jgi:2-polyprenyl-3-methyl-5-hydroxy-6-metoxy-1,4-benzoquinol methylase
VVLASEILEHLQMSLGSAMGRLARRLASDGCLIVTTPNLYRMNNLLKIVRGRNISEPFAERAVLRNGVVVDNRTHPREPVRAELALAMTQNRMRIIHADAFNSHPRHRLVRWLYAIGPKRFRDHIMLVGRPTTLD